MSEVSIHQDAHFNPPSNIQSLPPELLAEIFLNFLPRYPEPPPSFLCRICQQWCTVALSTPPLWRAISLEFSAFEPDEIHPPKLALLDNWLARSGNCPLSLAIRITDHLGSPLVDQLLRVALAHSERWEHVALRIPTQHMPLILGDMPQLRTLDLGPSAFSRRYGPFTLFDRAPQLRRLVLTEHFLKSALSLPWAQLTHLEAHCLYEHECLEILAEATSLVRCRASVCSNVTNIMPLKEAIPVRPHLRDLALVVDDPDDQWDWEILDHLTLPALRTLQVSQPCITLESIAAFMVRSQCALEELHVTRTTLPESAFREALPPFGAILLEEPDE
ncbi:hypothetical protein C8R46DRAFT_1001005 [Mycena filopes]|nr:hypothetical protein C8R46DRAFT_1001005 [Mycena filopes]